MNSPDLKEVIIAIFLVAVGALNAYLWKRLVFDVSYTNIEAFYLPLLTLFAFAALFALLSLFGKSNTLAYVAICAAFLGSFFFVQARTDILVVLLVTLFSAIVAYRRIRHEVDAAVVWRLSKIMRHGMPLFFTSVALVVSVFYFATIADTGTQSFLPKSVFDFYFPYLESSLQSFLPGFKSNATVDDVLLETIKTQLAGEIDFSQLSGAQLRELLGAQRSSVERSFGIKIKGSEKAGDFIYELTTKRLADIAGQYSAYIPYVAAFGSFLAIKTLTLPLHFISLGLIWAIMRALLALGVLKRGTVTVNVERITL